MRSPRWSDLFGIDPNFTTDTEITVRRVCTSTGSRIDPPLEDAWGDLQKLRWKAAVAQVDCGVAVTVNNANYTVNGKPYPAFVVGVEGASSGPHSVGTAWAVINGIIYGAGAVRRESVLR